MKRSATQLQPCLCYDSKSLDVRMLGARTSSNLKNSARHSRIYYKNPEQKNSYHDYISWTLGINPRVTD